MVAIVGGNSLGLNLGSLASLGVRGQIGKAALGQSGERAYVNAATGDLVLQDVDAALVGLGGSASTLRTYNSLGGFDFDGNADGWNGTGTKTLRMIGSALSRVDSDGSECAYTTKDGRTYTAVLTAGSALDRIIANSDGTYTWTDGATGATETYAKLTAAEYRIIRSADPRGNGLAFEYTNGLLTKVTNSDGEYVTYGYTGKNLTSVTTTLASGNVLSQVIYGYDTLNRLWTVDVKLNPKGDVPAACEQLASYRTTYDYEGSTSRVSAITQSDGTKLTFTYVLVGAAYRIETVTDGLGQKTTFSYDTAQRKTNVTDPYAVSTVLQYDEAGQLTEVRTGATAANPSGLSVVTYGYDATGDVHTITDGPKHTAVLTYVNGNLTRQEDGAGNVLERTYDAANQVVTEAAYPGGPGAQPQVTRYVHDAGNRNLLRFVISADGRVTEYRYDAQGLRTCALEYADKAYDTSALTATQVPTEAQLATWCAAQVQGRTARTDMAYDFRGQLKSVTKYASVDANGNGVGGSTTLYVYDQAGLLLQTVTPDGRTSTQTIYDGLGRVASTVVTPKAVSPDLQPQSVLTLYDDPSGKVALQLQNGLLTTSTYDKAGRLVSVVQGTAAAPNLGTTTYQYDADGRLLMTVDPTGQRSWILYDAAGRKVADVDGAGGLTEYVYDAAGRGTEVIRYATPVDTSALVDANGNPTIGWNGNPAAAPAGTKKVTLADVRKPATPPQQDVRSWSFYDDADRLTAQVDGLGYVTQTEYDGASRVVAVTRYATRVDVTKLGDGAGMASSAVLGLVAKDAKDRSESRIYDRSGLLLGAIDGEGYLREHRYDAAGRLVQTVAYAQKIAGFTDAASIAAKVMAARTAASLSGLVPASDPKDISTYHFYDAAGREVASVDGEGYVTELKYDANGRVATTIRYANKPSIAVSVTATLGDGLRPGSSSEDQVTSSTWDDLGRLLTQTNAEKTVTKYGYDAVGNLTSRTVALDTADQRSLLAQYDVQGRLTKELSAVGAALLAAGTLTKEQAWAQYATSYTYDGAGRRTTATDANGLRTVYFYDEAGRVRYVVRPAAEDASGEVTETAYDGLGHVKAETSYGVRVDAATVAKFQGGVISAPANAAAQAAFDAAKARSASDYNPNTNNATRAYGYDARGAETYESRGETYVYGGGVPCSYEGYTQTVYDAFGGVDYRVERMDPNHYRVDQFTYDRRGLADTSTVGLTSQLVAGSPIAGVKTRTVYDAFGRLTERWDGDGKHWSQAYDHAGRVVQATDPLNGNRTTTYDAFGRVLKQFDALGKATAYTYDTANRKMTVTTPEGVVVTTVHNREGQTLTVMDGNGGVKSYAYDADGNLKSVIETDPYNVYYGGAPQTLESYTYDAADRLIFAFDANQKAVRYTYDAANRVLTRAVDFFGLNLVTKYEYDAQGRRTKVTDPKGVVSMVWYDSKGEVLDEFVDVGGLSLRTSYRYDAAGRTLEVTEPGGTVTRYEYDDLGHRTREIVDPGAGKLNLTKSYAYDGRGNVVAVTEDLGNGVQRVTRYVYDDAGRQVYAVDGAGGVTNTEYDTNGRVAKTTTYGTPITLDGLGLVVSAAEVTGRVSAAGQRASPVVQQRVYDRDGRLAYAVDGVGGVTRYVYDGNGNVIEQITYANKLTGWKADGQPIVAPSPGRDLDVRTVYDALNRAIYTVDGVNAVVAQTYDGNGNVVERVAYAKSLPPGTGFNRRALDLAVKLIANDATDAHVRRVYDGANRLTWSVDGTGAVTNQVFDAAGNLVKVVAYANTIGAKAAPDTVTASAADRVTLMSYDGAGRQIFTVDALGGVTQQVYDNLGHVVQRIAYQTRLGKAPTATTVWSDVALEVSKVASEGFPPPRLTRAIYDAAGRLAWAIDASGAATENRYDGAGNLIAVIRYARVLTTPSQKIVVTPADLAAANDAGNRTTLYAYDAAGRRIFEVDGEGYVRETRYNGAGRVSAAVLYSNRAYGNLKPGATAADIRPTLRPDAGRDQVDQFFYDYGGRLALSVDAEGTRESFAYNGIGEKTAFTNEKDATWTYDYDAAGRLVQETSPKVDVTVVIGSKAGLFASGPDAQPIVTKTGYDALGRVTQRTEALGLAGERTTSYEYDAAGRQIATKYPPVGVYTELADNAASNGAIGMAPWEENERSLETRTYYDAFGDAVANVDVSNQVSLKAYDALGRVVYDVDAAGYVTSYGRNTYGEAETVTRYAKALTLNRSVARPATAAEIARELGKVMGGSDRTITTVFDAMGRAVVVVQPTVWVTSGDVSRLGSGNTRTSYNAFGEAVQVQRLVADVWATTTHLFDRRGLEVATLEDAAVATGPGPAKYYATIRSYDAAGNLLRAIEYANPLLLGRDMDPTPYASPDDRDVEYGYDRCNRRVSEIRHNVLAAESDGSAPATRRNIVTYYGYDAVGNKVSTTDALGAQTFTYYDALGRIAAVAAPTRTSTESGALLTPLTVFHRDANGNVVEKIEYAKGTAGATAGSYVAAAPSDDDRRTLTRYNLRGQAVEVQDPYSTDLALHQQAGDPLGGNLVMSYDAAGHLARQERRVTDYAVDASGNFTKVSRTLSTVFQYDALGRQTGVITPATTSVLTGGTIQQLTQDRVGAILTGTEYNAFGEMTRRGSWGLGQTAQYSESFEYDNAGRLWRTNSGDGTVRILLYDLLGRQTAEVRSGGVPDLMTLSGSDPNAAMQIADRVSRPPDERALSLRRTDMKRDLLGRVVAQTLPGRTDSQNHTFRPVVLTEYDRWGNITLQSRPYDPTAAGGPIYTKYRYNANDQLVEQLQPNAENLAYGGPVTKIDYDVLGRQVRTEDANTHVNRQIWDAGGQLYQEIHADAGIVTHKYDAFGQQKKLVDAMGYGTTYEYDKRGNNTAIVSEEVERYGSSAVYTKYVPPHDVMGIPWPQPDVLSDIAVTDLRRQSLVTRMAYDQAGRRIEQTNGNGETTLYAYDQRGNLVATQKPLGQVSRAAFDANGHQLAELDANGALATWSFGDAFGKLASHTDLGGHYTEYAYDNARQLETQKTFDHYGGPLSKSVEYTYDDAGHVTSIVDTDNMVQGTTPYFTAGQPYKRTTSYDYNAAGQRVQERVEQEVPGSTAKPIVYQDQTLAYDNLGRLKLVDGKDHFSIQFGYDDVGNRTYQVTTRETRYDGPSMTPEMLPANPVTDTRYFAYDAMNRQILVDGAVDRNVLNLANLKEGQGHILVYDKNGNRLSDTRWGSQVVEKPLMGGLLTVYDNVKALVTDYYEYDALNRLTKVSTGAIDKVALDKERSGDLKTAPGSAVTLEVRKYDGASRLVQVGSDGSLSTGYLDAVARGGNANADGARKRFMVYDGSGETLAQRTLKPLALNRGWAVESEVSYRAPERWADVFYGGSVAFKAPIYGSKSGYDAAGNATDYYTRTYDDAGVASLSGYHVNTVGYDGYRERGTVGWKDSPADKKETINYYDGAGQIISAYDYSKTDNGRWFVNDESGHILEKVQGGHVLRQVVVNGEVMGVYGNGTDPVKPLTDKGDPNFVAQHDFTLTYEPITNAYPSAAVGAYPVRSGDTLQSIAQAAYGDANLWYLIANANGLRSDADLRVGVTLNIPTRVTGASNSATTLKPYDPSKIVGSTTPQLPTPGGDGCGTLGIILMVAVTVAIAAFGQYELAPVLTSLMWGSELAGAVAAGAIAGAAGSMVGQVVGLATGVLTSFDWKAVALASVTQAVTAGVAKGFEGTAMALEDEFFARTAFAAFRAEVSNAAAQGLELALRLRDSFDWKDVAVSGVSAGVGAAVGAGVGSAMKGMDLNLGRFGNGLVTGTAAGIAAGATVSVLRGGRLLTEQVAADAFGNALGSSLAGEVQGSKQEAKVRAEDRRRLDVLLEQVKSLQLMEPVLGQSGGSYRFDLSGGNSGLAADDELGKSANQRAQAELDSEGTLAGTQRVITIGRGQGLLAAMASAGLNSAEQRAAYGQLISQDALTLGKNGQPIVQEGDSFVVDLGDKSQAALGGRAIAGETIAREAAAKAAAERNAAATWGDATHASIGSSPVSAPWTAPTGASTLGPRPDQPWWADSLDMVKSAAYAIGDVPVVGPMLRGGIEVVSGLATGDSPWTKAPPPEFWGSADVFANPQVQWKDGSPHWVPMSQLDPTREGWGRAGEAYLFGMLLGAAPGLNVPVTGGLNPLTPEGVAAKIITDPSTQGVQGRFTAGDLGEAIASDPVASRAYAKLQANGYDVTLYRGADDFAGTSGDGMVRLNLDNNPSLEDTLSTLIHESKHVDLEANTGSLYGSRGTESGEYSARALEFFYQNGRRPTAVERAAIQQQVRDLGY